MPDWTDTLAIRETGSERGFHGANTRLEDLAADEQPSIPGAPSVAPSSSTDAAPTHTAETARTAVRPATAKPKATKRPAAKRAAKKSGR